jgi:hypothetical protein
MLIIESNNDDARILGNTLHWVAEKYANIPQVAHCYMWDSNTEGSIDMSAKCIPSALIYNENTNVVEASLLFENIPCIYIGDFKEGSSHVPDIVIGKSNNKSIEKIIPLTKNTLNNLAMPPANNNEEIGCNVFMFSDSLSDKEFTKNEKIIQRLCRRHKMRIFGSRKLNMPNFLGSLSFTEKAEIIKSSKICIDLSGDSWHLCSYYNTPYLTKESGHGECTFKTMKDMDNKIQGILSGTKIPLTPKKYTFVTNTYLDVLMQMFKHLGFNQVASLYGNARKDLYAWHLNRHNKP